ncbi:glycerophosphodiester phosphodiesterase [Cellvibrio fontiphilus]|uniref:Glycerophosphodiester phosphodiesterase n=1 Tax=Cellvibrio fontiphilus TaxID=1815559 RepID=A0ABV7FC76_9GAMM
MKPLLCIAHRGGPAAGPTPLPENSLAAIKRALDLGVYAVEIDVFQIHGELFVTHDRRLGRVVSGQGVITAQSLDYLQAQRLENGEALPRLQQVLELVGDRALLNIEIKGENCVAVLARQLDDYLHSSGGSYEQYAVSSFDHQQLFQALQQMPQVKRGVLIEGIPLDYAACCEPLKAYSFNTHLSFLTPELIQDAQRRGLKNWVYTVNHEDDWQLMQQLGVDAVFTDKPDALIAFNQKIPA